MQNVVLLLLIAAITAGVVMYLVRSKKRGDTCIGCPHGKQCTGRCSGCGGQGSNDGGIGR